MFFSLSPLAPPSSEWLVNVLKIVAGKLAMLEILVLLAIRQVEQRTAKAATAFQAIYVSPNVEAQELSSGDITRKSKAET